ncbi:aspartate 1-decarboxylase, partial [Staphylococcus aureus]|uniref:aspartate 1-decarboxylase n=1 Tax=Staphylococcus aureus TaxID=1280 RepID=UPI0011A69687
MNAKIHTPTVTHSNLNYLPTITIHSHIFQPLHIFPNQKLPILNNNNPPPFQTYLIPPQTPTPKISLNPPPSTLLQLPHLLI